RHKIEPDPKSPRFIVTIPGAGYKLAAPRHNGIGQHSEAKTSEPERRHLTVLSCGLAGSIALTANSDPEDLANTICAFHDRCAPRREPSRGLTPQRQKDLIIDALIRDILSHADEQSLVMVLADAHWIDSSTLELVNRIIPLIKRTRVLFLIKFRPDF